GRGAGDPADELTDVGAELRWTAPAPFWVQRREPLLVERVDHLPRVLRGRGEHRRRLRRAAALHRGQHDPGPAQPDPVPRRAGDLHQSLRLGRLQLADEHLRLPCHHHLRRQPPRQPPRLVTTATFSDEALVTTATFSDEALAFLLWRNPRGWRRSSPPARGRSTRSSRWTTP